MEHSPFRWLLPLAVLALVVVGWEAVVRLNNLPPYVLPSPVLVATTLFNDRVVLLQSMLVTLETTLIALFGGVLGVLFFNSMRRLGQLELVITLSYVTLFSIIGGLMLSQVLTLYSTPAIYVLMDRFGTLHRRTPP